MKNNKGFSLVELIIVVALMGIIMGFASVGLSTLSNQNAKSSSKDIYNTLGTAKTIAMSKEKCYFVLTADTVRVVYYNSNTKVWITSSETDLNSNITLYYSTDNGSSYSQIGVDCDGIVIGFNRPTGAFNEFCLYDVNYESGTNKSPVGTAIDDIETIRIGKNDKAIRIELVKTTGKYSMEYGE